MRTNTCQNRHKRYRKRYRKRLHNYMINIIIYLCDCVLQKSTVYQLLSLKLVTGTKIQIGFNKEIRSFYVLIYA